MPKEPTKVSKIFVHVHSLGDECSCDLCVKKAKLIEDFEPGTALSAEVLINIMNDFAKFQNLSPNELLGIPLIPHEEAKELPLVWNYEIEKLEKTTSKNQAGYYVQTHSGLELLIKTTIKSYKLKEIEYHFAYHHQTKMVSVMLTLGEHDTWVNFYMADKPNGIHSSEVKYEITKAIETLVSQVEGHNYETQANEGEDMPLNVKQLNGLAVLKKIGVPQDLYDWFVNNVSAHGGTAVYDNGKMTLKKGEDAFLKVEMPLSHVHALNKGILAVHIKSDYKAKFTDALKALKHNYAYWDGQNSTAKSLGEIIEEYGLPPVKATTTELMAALNPSEVTQQIKNPSPFKKLTPADIGKPYFGPTHWTKADDEKLEKAHTKPELSSAGSSAVTVWVSDSKTWPLFPLDDLKTAGLVSLAEADHFYQPVKGTTKGKRYYCVALNKDFRLAIAYQDKEVSFRIESPDWDANSGKLIGTSFQLKNGYGSYHLAVADDDIARKSVGAFLMHTGIAWDTPLPNVAILKG